MAKPKGMFRRGSIWWARKDVPKELVAIIGKTSLQKSLGTSDQTLARVRFHVVMADFEARIERARTRLASAPASSFVVNLPWDKRNQELWNAVNAHKPEFQIRQMLEEASRIKPKKATISLDEVFEQWVKERQPTRNTEAEYKRARNCPSSDKESQFRCFSKGGSGSPVG